MGGAGVTDKEEVRVVGVRWVALRWRALEMGAGQRGDTLPASGKCSSSLLQGTSIGQLL